MYSCVLFDLDGTLLDSDFMIALTMHELYKLYRPGFKPHLRDMLYFSGPPLIDTMREEFPGQDPEFMRRQFVERSPKYYEDTVCLYRGAKEFLLSLKDKGTKLALVTNKAKGATFLSLRLTGLENVFDAVVSGDDVSRPKPDPEPLRKALSLLGAKPEDSLYIGDSEYDELAAGRIGIDMALAEFAPRKLLAGYTPKYRFDDYGELLGELYGNP